MTLLSKPIKLFMFSLMFFAVIFAGNTNISAQSTFAITENSVGRVRLGMTVAEARRAMPGYTFRRSSDGEGVALIEVRRRNRLYMTLYAGEENSSRPINDSAKIEQIEVWNSFYRTAKGVYPGIPVSRAERIYGKVQEIMMSEIESREYAKFTNQPDYLTFRVQAKDATAGVYPRGQMKSIRAASNAYIAGIIISERGNADNNGGSNAGFSSQFTDFAKDCETPVGQGRSSEHISTFCKGYGDYRVHIFDTATTLEINAETDKEMEIYHVATQSLDYDIDNQKLEWRMANGKPFAVILQASKYQTSQNGLISYPQKIVGSHYIVRGLEGFEDLSYEMDITRDPNLLQKAREMADAAYLKKNPSMENTGGNTSGGTGGNSSGTAFQNVDINQINQTIDQAARRGNDWVKSPMQILTRLTGDFSEMKNRTIELTTPTGEASGEILVTIINDGLLDDSVRSEKYMYKLEKTSGSIWKVTSAQKSWQCQQNRGHQDFSAVLCN